MALLLFVIWLLMCGRVTIEIVLTGLVLTALIELFSRKCLCFTYRHARLLLRRCPQVAACLAILFVQVVQANLQVARMIWNPAQPARPALKFFRDSLHSEWAHTFLIESITLTPGTIAVEGDGGAFWVHCLSGELMDGLQEGKLLEILRRIDERVDDDRDEKEEEREHAAAH